MLLTVLVWLSSLVTLLGRAAWLRALARAFASRLFGQQPLGYRRAGPPSRTFPRTPAKPEWVRREIIRLKALLPLAGCRAISDIFNRRFAAKRSEEHTSELQSRSDLVCRLLLEKKKSSTRST